jgi:transcriptional regulator with XRE-family HTH domain
MPDREVVPGLAGKLKAAREAAGLTQKAAGEKADVHHVSIARFETETRVPTLAVLYKLADAYGVGVCDLLPDAERPPGRRKK